MYDPTKPRTQVFFPAVLSGVLMYCAYFPFNLGFLAWLGLIPLLTLVEANARPRRIYGATFIGGLYWFVPALQWIRVAHPAMNGSWIVLAVFCSVFLVLTMYFVRWLRRRGLPLWLAAPIGFVAWEYARTHFPVGYEWLDYLGMRVATGFGWYLIGHTQHDWLALIQIADITGVYGITFIVVMVNAVLCTMLLQHTPIRQWFAPRPRQPETFWLNVSTVVSVLAALLYGVVLIVMRVTGMGMNSLTDGEIIMIYGATVVVIVLNMMVCCTIYRQRTPNDTSSPTPALASNRTAVLITASLLVGMVLYGIVRLQHADFEQGPQVALIQGNLAQDLKILKGDVMADHFGKLCEEAVRPKDKKTPRPDLVIWPETSYVDPWFDVTPGSDLRNASLQFQRAHNLFRDALSDNVRRWQTPQLMGMNCLVSDDDKTQWKYNSAVMMDEKGRYLGRYDKIHLVLFGEYVPFRKTLPFLQRFTPYEGDYSCKPGETWTRFEVRGQERAYVFGVVICYEDSDPSLGRAYVAPGTEKVDFLVNISNDGWFNGTAQHEQHLAIARFRAVESRRSLVRAVNMGISAIVDADGQIVALPGATWSESKKVEGIVRGTVPIDSRSSLYAQLGDWFPILCWLVILGGIIRARFYRPKQAA